jgi:hypothetical protein
LGNGVTVTGSDGGDYNAVFLKYGSSGLAQWAQTVTADSNGSEFNSVAVDSSGNVYVAGFLSGPPGPVGFGNGVTVSKADKFNNAVLVKYNASGTAQWVRTAAAGLSDSSFNSVAVDPAGNVYVAGEMDGTGTYDFGNNVTATGTAVKDGLVNVPGNAVLAKYDSSGTAQWARTVIAGSPDSSFSSVAADSAGNVYAAGSIAGTGTYDFGNGAVAAGTAIGGPFANTAYDSVLLVKYNSSGTAQWAQTVTALASSSDFGSVAVDSAGNVYAAGSIHGEGSGSGSLTYDFGNGVTAVGTDSSDVFEGMAGSLFVVLVKYNSSGLAQWAQTVAGGPNSYFTSVAVDSAGSVYASGDVFGYDIGTYDFGNGATVTATSSGQGGYHVALVKYDSSGLAQWALSSVNGGSSTAVFNSVAVDSRDNVFAAGAIGGSGTLDFGNNLTVVSTDVDGGGGWSALLIKY